MPPSHVLSAAGCDMLGSSDTRRAQLSAVVRVQSPASIGASNSSQPDAYVWPEGPRRVAVELYDCRAARAQRGSFEVSTVLPLDASPEEVCAGVGTPVVGWLWEGFNAVLLSYGQACSGKTSLLLGSGPCSSRETGCGESTEEALACDADEPSGNGGLLRGILRDLFGCAGAAAKAADEERVKTGLRALQDRGHGDAGTGSRTTAWGSSAEEVKCPGERKATIIDEEDRNHEQHGRDRSRRDTRATVVVAISAWEVVKNTVVDLLSPAENLVHNGSVCGNNGSSNKTVRDRNRGNGGGSGGKGSRRGRSRSRGRSGSDDSSAGRPSRYPEGFATVKAPDLRTAMELVDSALRHRSEIGKGRVLLEPGKGGPGRHGAEKKHGKRDVSGHVFFRVVLYKGNEETVSTLHLVDLTGGWEPSAEKPSGKRSNKSSPSTSTRPNAVASRDIQSFDAMIASLVRPDLSPPDDSKHHSSAVQSNRDGGGDGFGPPRSGGCIGSKVVDGDSRWMTYADSMRAAAPQVVGSLSDPSPPPLPEPHPLFEPPKMNARGGGGGELVAALRPLMSGNARTWLVVSVGGKKDGGEAAWRVLDVAQRATTIATTCIRLRGVALADLCLLDARDVISRSASTSPPPRRMFDVEVGTGGSKPDTSTCAEHYRGEGRGPAVRFSEPPAKTSSEKSWIKGPRELDDSDGLERVGGFHLGTQLIEGEGEGQESTSLNKFLEGFHRGSDASGSRAPAKSSRDGEPLDARGAVVAARPNAGVKSKDRSSAGASYKTVAAVTVLQGDADDTAVDDSWTSAQRRAVRQQPSSTHDSAGCDFLGRVPTGLFSLSTLRIDNALRSSKGEAGRCETMSGKGAVGESGDNVISPHAAAAVEAASRTRSNIDRMVSSLLEDVLPAGRRVAARQTAVIVRAAKQATNVDHHEAPRLPLVGSLSGENGPPPPPPPVPNQITMPSRPSSATSRSGTESTGEHGRFFTPIEVLMHASTGSEGFDLQQQHPQGQEIKHHGTKFENRQAKPAGGTATGGKQNNHGSGGRGNGGSTRGPRKPRGHPAAEGNAKNGTTPSQLVAEANGNDRRRDVVTQGRGGEGASESAKGVSNCRPEALRPVKPTAAPAAEPMKAAEAADGSVQIDDSREVNGGACDEEKVPEAEGLQRRSNAALLRVVREQEERTKQVRAGDACSLVELAVNRSKIAWLSSEVDSRKAVAALQMQRRLEAKESDWLERVTALEAELEGFRAEAIQMRGKLKRAEASSPSVALFARYEAQVGLLEAENAALRDSNLSLELRLLDILRETSSSSTTSAAAPALLRGVPASDQSARQRERVREERSGASNGERGLTEEDDGRSVWPAVHDDGKFAIDEMLVSSAEAPGVGAPSACNVALRDVRRRLKEAEQEVKEMRLEQASVDRRERQHRQLETDLTASRLECARAEAVMERNAAEIDRWREGQAALKADKDALILELAEERRKSRRFDEDRRAYGHIRRFIEQHAGGRPPEWDLVIDGEREREDFHKYGRGGQTARRWRHGASGGGSNDGCPGYNTVFEASGGDKAPGKQVRMRSRQRIFADEEDDGNALRPGEAATAAKHAIARDPQVWGSTYCDAFQRDRKLPEEWDAEDDEEFRFVNSYAKTAPTTETIARGGEAGVRGSRAAPYEAGIEAFRTRDGRLDEENEWAHETGDRGQGMRREEGTKGDMKEDLEQGALLTGGMRRGQLADRIRQYNRGQTF